VVDMWFDKGKIVKVAVLIQSFKGFVVYTTDDEEDIYIIP
jgi:hypothetical protein